MLPNLKIVICAVMFAVIVFAVTGAGVFMPETYTRIGEMPEIGRPMMQRMITDEPAQAQFHILTLTRRSEELDQLRQRSALEVAPVFAQIEPGPDIPKPAVIENPEQDTIVATVAVAPVLQPSGAMRTVTATASGAVQMQPATTDDAPDAMMPPDAMVPPATPAPSALPPTAPPAALPPAALPAAIADADAVQVAALPPTAETQQPEPAPTPQVKVPHLRPTAKANATPRRSFHRTHRFARLPQSNALDQGMFGPSFQAH